MNYEAVNLSHGLKCRWRCKNYRQSSNFIENLKSDISRKLTRQLVSRKYRKPNTSLFQLYLAFLIMILKVNVFCLTKHQNQAQHDLLSTIMQCFTITSGSCHNTNRRQERLVSRITPLMSANISKLVSQ